jgi:hypothetical protein
VRFGRAVFMKVWDGERQAMLPETEEPVPPINKNYSIRPCIQIRHK